MVTIVSNRPPLPLGSWGSQWHREHPLPLGALVALGTWWPW